MFVLSFLELVHVWFPPGTPFAGLQVLYSHPSFSRYRLIEVRFRIKPVHLDVGRTLTCQFPSTKTVPVAGVGLL